MSGVDWTQPGTIDGKNCWETIDPRVVNAALELALEMSKYRERIAWRMCWLMLAIIITLAIGLCFATTAKGADDIWERAKLDAAWELAKLPKAAMPVPTDPQAAAAESQRTGRRLVIFCGCDWRAIESTVGVQVYTYGTYTGPGILVCLPLPPGWAKTVELSPNSTDGEILAVKPEIVGQQTPNASYAGVYVDAPNEHRHIAVDGKIVAHDNSNNANPRTAQAHENLLRNTDGTWPKYIGPRPPDVRLPFGRGYHCPT